MSAENYILMIISLACAGLLGFMLLLGFIIDKYEEHQKKGKDKPNILG